MWCRRVPLGLVPLSSATRRPLVPRCAGHGAGSPNHLGCEPGEVRERTCCGAAVIAAGVALVLPLLLILLHVLSMVLMLLIIHVLSIVLLVRSASRVLRSGPNACQTECETIKCANNTTRQHASCARGKRWTNAKRRTQELDNNLESPRGLPQRHKSPLPTAPAPSCITL